jgi:hypothetical protein
MLADASVVLFWALVSLPSLPVAMAKSYNCTVVPGTPRAKYWSTDEQLYCLFGDLYMDPA